MDKEVCVCEGGTEARNEQSGGGWVFEPNFLNTRVLFCRR